MAAKNKKSKGNIDADRTKDGGEAVSNYQHELFCQEYAGGEYMGNATRSYLAAGYDCSEESARRLGNLLLTNVDIKQRVAELQAERLERLQITADSILARVNLIAKDKQAKDSDQLKALELLMKHKALMTDNINHTGELPVAEINLNIVKRRNADS